MPRASCEPFALLPLGYLLLFTGMVLTVIPLLRKGAPGSSDTNRNVPGAQQ
jgi:hypothetical protein